MKILGALLILAGSISFKSSVSHAGIAYGEEVPQGKFSPVVELFIDDNPVCTATIVGPKAIVTSAHCTDGLERKEKAYFNLNGEKYPVELYPSRFYSHQDWLVRNDAHDMMPGLVKKEVKGVTPATICGQPAVGMEAFMLGYGDTESGESCGVLRITSNIISRANPGGRVIKIGPNPGGGGGNTGDSGGPVFISDDQGKTCLTGVMSYVKIRPDNSLPSRSEMYTVANRLDNVDSAAVLSEFTSRFGVKICGINKTCEQINKPVLTENLLTRNNRGQIDR